MGAQHSDRTIYIIWVLWLIGMSESNISRALLPTGVIVRRKQIAGIVGRSPYRNRSGMRDDERQAALDELAAVRFGDHGASIDLGALDRVPMKIIPLRGVQRKKRSN